MRGGFNRSMRSGQLASHTATDHGAPRSSRTWASGEQTAMYKLSEWVISVAIMTAAVILAYIPLALGAALESFSNVRLIEDPSNDGDSFQIDAGGRHLHIRLYYIDCPETTASSKGDAQRLREQTRYFGLPSPERTVYFGKQAKAFVQQQLSKPFTIHTSYASGLGRSAEGRIYGFVTTAEGDDLATLLVKNGFARTYGVGRETPAGVARVEMVERLHDLEMSAMLRRTGIWAESDPDRIVRSREQQRKEDRELRDLQRETRPAPSPDIVLDLNTASREELESINGITPGLAARIVAGRPYRTVDELRSIKGIGQKRFRELRPHFTVDQRGAPAPQAGQ